jgi:hypothetical protein
MPPATPGLGDGPTGRPAQVRAAMPVIQRDQSPSSGRDTAEIRYPHVDRSRRSLLGFSVGAGLALVLAAVWFLMPVSAVEIDDPPALTAPGTPLGEREAPTAEPAPVAAPLPAPVPVPPSTSTSTSTSTPKPAPRPPPAAARPAGTASITFSGDAKSVWLVETSSKRRVEAGTAVAPGRYGIVADFGDPEPANAGNVDLRSGEQRHYTCSRSFSICKESLQD